MTVINIGGNVGKKARRQTFGGWSGVLLFAALLVPVVASANAGGGVCDIRSSVCFGVDWKKATAADLANIDINDGAQPGGLSPMHAAIVHGNADNLEGLVQTLVRMGADINAQGKSGWTPLHHAVFSRRAEDAAVLLRAGADANIGDIEGNTPLHLAGVFGWHSSVVKDLIKHGADAEKRTLHGYTPLLGASRDILLVPERPSADIYRTLLRASNINARDDNGRTALHLAARGRNPVAVSVLLEAGVDVDIVWEEEHQLTPLALAVLHPKNTEVIELLLAGGANVCVKFPVGKSVLEAVKEYHEEKKDGYAEYYDIFRRHLDAGHHCPCCGG